MRQVAGALGRHQQDGRRAVILLAAVEQPERLGDPARGVIVLLGQRPAVHHRARVLLGVVIGGHGDRPQRRPFDAVLMGEALVAHGVFLRGRHDAVGHGEGVVAARRAAGRRLAEPLELPLGERAEDDHAARIAAGDGRGCIRDGRGAAAPAAAPLHVGEGELPTAERGGDARGVVAVVGIGGEAVDLRRVDAGVLGRGQDRHQGQLELGVRTLAVLPVGRLADAGDRHLAPDREFAHGAPPLSDGAEPKRFRTGWKRPADLAIRRICRPDEGG